jgi:type VI protein secretion system component VasF
MNNFEDDLRQALRRKAPPEGFSERVLERAGSHPVRSPQLKRGSWFPIPRWAVAAALVLCVVGGFELHRQRQHRVEGELAKQQVILALKITAEELQFAQKKIEELNSAR